MGRQSASRYAPPRRLGSRRIFPPTRRRWTGLRPPRLQRRSSDEVLRFWLQIAILDRGPVLEPDDRLVLLEAHALADEAHVAFCELAEHVLHGAHGVHQERDAVDRD